jgi:hyperosmotically inducible protein
MKLLTLAAALAAAAIATTACDRARTDTAVNNSGTSATPAQPAGSVAMSSSPTPPAENNAAANGTSTTTTTTTTTPDTASPNAPGTASPSDNTGNGGAAGAVNETVTTGKIKAAIAADSAMKDSDISVTTKDGIVTLSGTVKSQDQVSIATNLAQRQEGVQRVESNISVR